MTNVGACDGNEMGPKTCIDRTLNGVCSPGRGGEEVVIRWVRFSAAAHWVPMRGEKKKKTVKLGLCESTKVLLSPTHVSVINLKYQKSKYSCRDMFHRYVIQYDDIRLIPMHRYESTILVVGLWSSAAFNLTQLAVVVSPLFKSRGGSQSPWLLQSLEIIFSS